MTQRATLKLSLYLLLFGVCCVTSVWMFQYKYWFALIVIFLLLFLIIRQIITLYQNTIRKIFFLFSAIESNDYSFRFSENIADPYNRMLNEVLNRIKEIMTLTKIKAEEREKYYELIMNSVKTGIITINEKGSVYQVNREALNLFGLSILTHLKQLNRIESQLYPSLTNLKTGERSQLSFSTERGNVSISASASNIQYDGKLLKIIAINDINNELDEKQVESWMKLTRVLTHEIMNSLAPITSLSDTLIRINPNKSNEIAQGLNTIHATSQNLIAFVDSYRKFTRLQAPIRTAFPLKPLIERTSLLICRDIPFKITVSPNDTLLYADENMITQVLVNLLKNAVQASQSRINPLIEIDGIIDNNENIIVHISNQGTAIPKDIVDDIFMPFFTTKKEGSGIGLSIVKQIMHLHGGSVSLTSNNNERITFTLKF